jgi:hypothetical protein
VGVDFSVNIKGSERFQTAISDMRVDRGRWLADAFVEAGHAHRNVIVRDYLSGPASRTRLASRTGALINSVKVVGLGRDGVRIGSDLVYAEVHEFNYGARRSWLLRSINQVVPDLYEAIIVRRWEETLG